MAQTGPLLVSSHTKVLGKVNPGIKTCSLVIGFDFALLFLCEWSSCLRKRRRGNVEGTQTLEGGAWVKIGFDSSQPCHQSGSH